MSDDRLRAALREFDRYEREHPLGGGLAARWGVVLEALAATPETPTLRSSDDIPHLDLPPDEAAEALAAVDAYTPETPRLDVCHSCGRAYADEAEMYCGWCGAATLTPKADR